MAESAKLNLVSRQRLDGFDASRCGGLVWRGLSRHFGAHLDACLLLQEVSKDVVAVRVVDEGAAFMVFDDPRCESLEVSA